MFKLYAIGSILAIISSFSLLVMIICFCCKRSLFSGDIFKILTILFISGIINLTASIANWFILSCQITPFLRIFSEISMFIWILILIYRIFHYSIYREKMSVKMWIISTILGYVLPILIAFMGFLILKEKNREKEDMNFCRFENDFQSQIYILCTCILQIILYLFGFLFFIKARLEICNPEILSKEQREIRRRFLLVFRFVTIHFFIYILSISSKIYSFFVSYLCLAYKASFIFSNSIGILYLFVFLFSYVFNKNLIVVDESKEIINTPTTSPSGNLLDKNNYTV